MRNYAKGKELPKIQSIPPHQLDVVVVVSWCRHVWLLVKLDLFIDDVTAD